MKKLIIIAMTLLMLIGCGKKPEPEPEPEYIPTDADFLAALADVKVSDKLAFYKVNAEYAEANGISLNEIPTERKDWGSVKFVTMQGFGDGMAAGALEYISDENVLDGISLETGGIMEALDKLVTGKADVLAISEGVIEKLKENEDLSKYVSFLDSFSSYDKSAETMDFSLTRNAFNLLIAGSDSREAALDETSRYDVDILMTVNPVTKQMLIISIPRDSYVPNPAYDYGKDKLTHLGSNGPECSMEGLSMTFDTEIKLYAMTNFVEFINFVDMLGGLDFYNPYAFTLNNGGRGSFAKGNIHINGTQALGYSRERFNLKNGDIDRNEHNMILLNAIIDKVFAWENLAKFDQMYAQFRKCFLTNVSEEQIAAFALKQYTQKPEWNIVSYHIRGSYSNKTCSSHVSSGPLTVCNLYDDDLDYVKIEINKVLNGEIISHGNLPSD